MTFQPKSGFVDTLVSPILLLEDNPMDIDFALQAFTENQLNNPIVICRDGEEALTFIKAHTAPDDLQLPALVLLDLHLPKIDGFEVLRQIRQDVIWKQIPVVVLTVSHEITDISRAYQLGANSYIIKPLNFADFTEMMQYIKAYWLQVNQPPFPKSARNRP
ncbi:response regulator [Methylobacter psychrophilus]|uniref:response regulator n=1 Tax=Methylobacter psychrophilus TaxID=96941 RepID=UPI0021D4C15C|nr:response regulator [Methylobacter psychrophilus]